MAILYAASGFSEIINVCFSIADENLISDVQCLLLDCHALHFGSSILVFKVNLNDEPSAICQSIRGKQFLIISNLILEILSRDLRAALEMKISLPYSP